MALSCHRQYVEITSYKIGGHKSKDNEKKILRIAVSTSKNPEFAYLPTLDEGRLTGNPAKCVVDKQPRLLSLNSQTIPMSPSLGRFQRI
jgi:hypothetical protein